VREGGSHTIWAAADDPKRRAPMPRHREIDAALAKAICRQLGVPAAVT
jgi:HicA toxin of bacterial toxin-antitoxin,